MKTLLFVYNANSGIGQAVLDWGHKIVSPATYQCDLCSLSYGNFGMRTAWKAFINELSIEHKFIYKNELPAEAPEVQNSELPFVAIQSTESTTIILPASDFKTIKSEAELIKVLQVKLQEYKT